MLLIAVPVTALVIFLTTILLPLRSRTKITLAIVYIVIPLPLSWVTETLFNGLRDPSVRYATVFQDVDCDRLAEIRFMCDSLLPNLMVALSFIWKFPKFRISPEDDKKFGAEKDEPTGKMKTDVLTNDDKKLGGWKEEPKENMKILIVRDVEWQA